MAELAVTTCGIRILMMNRARCAGMTLDTRYVGASIDDADDRGVSAGMTGGTGIAVRVNNLGEVSNRMTGGTGAAANCYRMGRATGIGMGPTLSMATGTGLHRSSLAGCDSCNNRRIRRVMTGVAGVPIAQTARDMDIDRIQGAVATCAIIQVLESMRMIAMREDLIRMTLGAEDLSGWRIDRVADQGVVTRCLMTDGTVPTANRHMLGDGISVMTGVTTTISCTVAISITKGNLAMGRAADCMAVTGSVTIFTITAPNNHSAIDSWGGLDDRRCGVAVGAGIIMNPCHYSLWIADRIIIMTDNTVSRLQGQCIRITVPTMTGHIVIAMTSYASSVNSASSLAVGNGSSNSFLQRQAFRISHGRSVVVMAQNTAIAAGIDDGHSTMQGIDVRHAEHGPSTGIPHPLRGVASVAAATGLHCAIQYRTVIMGGRGIMDCMTNLTAHGYGIGNTICNSLSHNRVRALVTDITAQM